jgi:hypothetical protein
MTSDVMELNAAVFNQKKRAGIVSGAQKQTHASQNDPDGSDEDPVNDDTAADGASKSAVAVMQDLRQRLRARSKEVLVLVRTAALNILSPAHIQAVLELVGEVPGSSQQSHRLSLLVW